MQIIGGHFSEERILNVAHRYQRESDWHARAPAGYT
jgi:aspartyl-tRNA(Asn)/glutamyl-tRNA(Gln) amidotransferase subunit A